MATHAEPARKPAETPSRTAAPRGAHAETMDAAPRVRALRATGAMLNARPAQRAEKPNAGKPAGPEIASLLDRLAATAEQVEETGPQAGKQPSEQLLTRVAKLRAVADGDDEPAKQALLAALQAELGRAGPAPKAVQKPVQRVVDPVTAGIVAGVALGVGLLVGLGFLARRVYRYYQERNEDAIYERFANDPHNFVDPPIPDELTDGVAALIAPGARAARIFANLNNFRFRYTGGFVPARVAMVARQGDCQTLADMYMAVANHVGLPAQRHTQFSRMLVAPRPIHGRSETGNTEGNTAWYFFDHYWVSAGGNTYDVLFMVSPPPQMILRVNTHRRGEVTYYEFADGRCLIESRDQDELDVPIRGIGRVFPNALATQTFIDDHAV